MSTPSLPSPFPAPLGQLATSITDPIRMGCHVHHCPHKDGLPCPSLTPLEWVTMSITDPIRMGYHVHHCPHKDGLPCPLLTPPGQLRPVHSQPHWANMPRPPPPHHTHPHPSFPHLSTPPSPPQLNHVSALPLPSAALPSVAVSFADVPVKIPRLGVTPQAVAALVGPLPGVHSRVSPERVRAREGLPARRTRRGLLGKQPEPPASLHGL